MGKRGKREELLKTELTGFQSRVILAMVSEMATMKETTERTLVMFAALAKSVGVEIDLT